MSVHLFTASFQAATNIPADAMVNTWYFEGGGSDPENVGDMIFDFYDDVPTGSTVSPSSYLSELALTGQVTITGYDLAEPKPRVPMYESIRNLTELNATASLPTEVALVFSYHSAPASGVAAGRRRGRIYLGGFAATANASGRPQPGLIDTLADAGRDLIQASNASTSWQWQQYSQENAAGAIVTGGWIDNSWDTQRRRGIASSARVTFTGGTP